MNEIHGLEGGQPEVGGLTLGQLHCDHTHRPNIDKLVVKLFLDQLWCHPGGSAHNGLPVFLLLGQLDGEPEVRDLDSPIFIHQNVITLQVSVDLLQLVQCIQALQDLLHNERTNFLIDALHVLVDDLGQRPSIHILDEHEQALHVVVGVMVVDNVGVGAHRHDCSLHLDFLEDVVLGDLHHAHCPALVAVLSIECLVDRAHGTLAQLLGEPVAFVRVVGLELDPGHLLVELQVGQEGVLGDLISLVQVGQDGDEGLGVLPDFVLRDVVLLEKAEHVLCEPLDTHGAVHVDLQVHLVLEIGGSASLQIYLLMQMGCWLMNWMMASGSSSSGLISWDRCLVLVSRFMSTSMGRSQFLAHYSGTPHSLPVTGSLVILTPEFRNTGWPYSSFRRWSSVSLDPFVPISLYIDNSLIEFHKHIYNRHVHQNQHYAIHSLLSEAKSALLMQQVMFGYRSNIQGEVTVAGCQWVLAMWKLPSRTIRIRIVLHGSMGRTQGLEELTVMSCDSNLRVRPFCLNQLIQKPISSLFQASTTPLLPTPSPSTSANTRMSLSLGVSPSRHTLSLFFISSTPSPLMQAWGVLQSMKIHCPAPTR